MAQHKLQRLTSPSRSSSLLLHWLGASIFTYCFLYLLFWKTPINTAYGSHFQFLTMIGLTAALVAFYLAVLADLTMNQSLFAAKNAVAIIATPLEVVISILYWGLVFIDPKLVRSRDVVLTGAIDLGIHLAPAVFLSTDLILFSPPWTIPAYTVMALSTGFAFSYWYWVELCFSKNGWYPYPLFALLSTAQRVLLFTFSAVLITVSSSSLKWVYAFVNGYEAARKEAYKPLKKIQ